MRWIAALILAIAVAGAVGSAEAKRLHQHKDNPTKHARHHHGLHQHKDNPTKRGRR